MANKNYVRVSAGIVIEVISTATDINDLFHPSIASQFITAPKQVVQGWLYDGNVFSEPPPVELVINEPVPTITPRQLRLWLLSRGLLAQVPTLIDATPEPDKSVAQIEWEFATVFEHNNPLVLALGAAVGMTAEDIEAGFREAAKL